MPTTSHMQRYEQLKVLSAKLISEIPEVMAGFGELHSCTVATGALDKTCRYSKNIKQPSLACC